MKPSILCAVALACGLASGPTMAQTAPNPAMSPTAPTGVDRLYVFDCGQAHAADQSRWSPGVNVGKPIDVVDTCYLIHHARGYLLWDTGVPDAVAAMPQGMPGAMPWRRAKTLRAQLDEIGVAIGDIKLVAVSHTHGDHVGNVDLFPEASVLIQKAEYDFAFAAPTKPFSADHKVVKLDGDHDVFGDGSVRIISTPGHTPGHESLAVHLPKTGWLVLTGDAAHFQDNWDNRRVPSMNTDKDQTLASMQKLSELVGQLHAQLWINHDKAQGDAARHSPAFYE